MTTPTLPEYIARMVEEYKQLNERITKTNNMFRIENMHFNWSKFELVTKQVEAMLTYRNVLAYRLRDALMGIYYNSSPETDKFKEWLKEIDIGDAN